MTWRDQALCAGMADATFSSADPFFVTPKPDRKPGGKPVTDVYVEARKWCAECPVRTECADDAIRVEGGMPWGFRGGLTADQRKALHRKGARGTRVVADLPRGLKADRENERRDLYEQGLSDRRMAELTGLDESSIRQWRARRGLPANYASDGSGRVTV